MIPLSCKLKLKRLLLYLLQVLRGCSGFQERIVSILRKPCHNTNSAIVSITPLSGPSVANVFASLMLERQTPPSHLYGTSHMSSVEPVSRKRVRSVGPLHQDIATMLNEYT